GAGHDRHVRAPVMADQHGGGALAAVEQERRRRQPLAAGAQHIGGADIARADLTDVAEARRPGQQQAEGDGAQEIAQHRAEIRGPSIVESAEKARQGEAPYSAAAKTVRPSTMLRSTRPWTG